VMCDMFIFDLPIYIFNKTLNNLLYIHFRGVVDAESIRFRLENFQIGFKCGSSLPASMQALSIIPPNYMELAP
jgi:hypothetical protein